MAMMIEHKNVDKTRATKRGTRSLDMNEYILLQGIKNPEAVIPQTGPNRFTAGGLIVDSEDQRLNTTSIVNNEE